jgi:hypothetical protein
MPRKRKRKSAARKKPKERSIPQLRKSLARAVKSGKRLSIRFYTTAIAIAEERAAHRRRP